MTLGGDNGAQCGTAELPVVTMWTQFMGTLQHHNINNWDNIDLGSIVSVS